MSGEGGSRQIKWPGGVCIEAQLGASMLLRGEKVWLCQISSNCQRSKQSNSSKQISSKHNQQKGSKQNSSSCAEAHACMVRLENGGEHTLQ